MPARSSSATRMWCRSRPRDRDIALVFQQYALYPHMSVRQNLEYPLKIQKISKEEMTKRVDDAAKLSICRQDGPQAG